MSAWYEVETFNADLWVPVESGDYYDPRNMFFSTRQEAEQWAAKNIEEKWRVVKVIEVREVLS